MPPGPRKDPAGNVTVRCRAPVGRPQKSHAETSKTRQLLVLAALSTTACVGANLDITFSETASESRFVMLSAQSEIDCGKIAEVRAKGRVPPLLTEKPSERLLLELKLEGFKDEETIDVVRLNIDPATVGEAVTKLPTPIKMWRLTSEGEIKELPPEPFGDLYLVTAKTCSDRVEKACRGIIECPKHEIVLDEQVPETVYGMQVAASDTSLVVVSGGRASWVRDEGATQIRHPEPILATCETRSGQIYVLDSKMCILEVNNSGSLQYLSCLPTPSRKSTIGSISEGPDGQIWIATEAGIHTYSNGAWHAVLSAVPTNTYYKQIIPLDDQRYLLLGSSSRSDLMFGSGELVRMIPDLGAQNIVRSGPEVFLLPLDSNDPHLYRINIAQTLSDDELSISRELLDLPSPTAIAIDNNEPVVATVIGTIHSLGWQRDCPYPRVERMPRAMSVSGERLVIVGDDISDFTNQVSADTRVYVIRTTPIEDCRSDE